MDMNLTIEESVWDVAVIGGGPSGMMAAGRAAERGAKVILIEKNENLGKKLLISGGGRCNLTNAEFDTRKFLDKFKYSNKYLFSTFSKWNIKDTLNFFNSRKMETKVEAFQRVFPITDKAQSVLNVLVEYMKQGNVKVVSNTEVSGFEVDNKKIIAVKTKNNQNIYAKQFILATGGTSHPETGSTGDGFKWLQKIGHEIVEPSAALVPIALKDVWIKDLQGTTLEKTKISIFQNNVKQASRMGKILFTHFGVSGPTILNMSQEVGELLKYGDVVISLDILPGLDYGQLNLKLQEIFKEHSNKNFKNSLATLIPSSFIPIIINLSSISGDTLSNSVTREQRLKLIQVLKSIPLNVKGLLGAEKAIITSGGVKPEEVDWKSMHSKIFPNLFLIGDILNIDRPSGGYSLQLCWTTGFVAGDSVEIY